MSKDTSSWPVRAVLLPGKAWNSAGSLGEFLRCQLQGSVDVLPIHLLSRFAGALNFTQAKPARNASDNKSEMSSWRQKLRGPEGQFGGPVRVVLSAVFIFLLSQTIALFLIALGHSLTGGQTDLSSLLETSTGWQFFYILFAEGLAGWLALRLVKRRGLGLSAIGLGRRPQSRDLKWAAGGFAAFYVLWIGIALIITLLAPNLDLNQQQDVGFTNLSGHFDYVLAFISLVILPPLGEETLVRGYLFSGLRSRLMLWPALLVTSLLFGVAHIQSGHSFFGVWGAAIDTFVLSAVLVFVREKTGALFACFGIHALNNVVAFIVHFHG